MFGFTSLVLFIYLFNEFCRVAAIFKINIKYRVVYESLRRGQKVWRVSQDVAFIGLKPYLILENAEACDLLKGKWVPDSRPPVYTNSTCKFIQGHQNCIKNGRPDLSFLKWKWQPEKCDLPRIDAQSFLNAMRNRAMAFAGDSIARNQFQSLLCQLSQVLSLYPLVQRSLSRSNESLQ